MSGWPARGFGAAAWVAVVVVGAFLVWLVISRAGAGLVADAGPVTAPSSAPASDGPTADSPGAARRANWQGESGVVAAVCQGGAIALVGAQPEEGTIVHVKDQGPKQLVVAFEGDDDGPVTVVATCRDGRPQFKVTAGAPGDPSSTTPSSTATSGGADDNGGDDSSGHGSGHGSDDRSDGASGDD